MRVLSAGCSFVLCPCRVRTVHNVLACAGASKQTRNRHRVRVFAQWRPFGARLARLATEFEHDLQIIKRIFAKYAQPQPVPPLSLLAANGQSFLGPWPTLANFVRFSAAQASRLRHDFAAHFLERDGFVAISAAGLAAACAEHGTAFHLMVLASEDERYRCPLRSFLRLVDSPSSAVDCVALQSVRVLRVAGAFWFDEQSILSLFAAQTKRKLARLIDQLTANTSQPSHMPARAFLDEQTQQILPAGKKVTENRRAVLSPQAASALYRNLLSNALPSQCAMRTATVAAAERIFEEAQRAQPQPHRRRDLAIFLSQLTAQALARLPTWPFVLVIIR